MKVIMSTIDIAQLGNKRMWDFLRLKGMDMSKPIYGYPCNASNTIYGFAYEGEVGNNNRITHSHRRIDDRM